MADDFSIQRKDLLPALKKIDKKEWMVAAEKLGLILTQPSGGSSHVAIRDSSFPITDQRGFVTVVYGKMSKIVSVNQKVFKRFLKHGILEEDLWKALQIIK